MMNTDKRTPDLKKQSNYHGHEDDGSHNNKLFGHKRPEERCELLSRVFIFLDLRCSRIYACFI